MALFKNFPWTDMHALNQNEILEFLKQASQALDEAQERLDGFDARLTGLESNYADLTATVATLRTEVTALQLEVNSLSTTVSQHGTIIDSFQTTLTSIEERLTIIVNDITTLYANVDRVETESKQRDNALGSRVTILESAVINPITVRNSKVNSVLFGSDLRFCAVDPDTNLPYGMSWQGETPQAFSYVPDEGFLIGDDYWNSKYLKIQTDCYQLQRNVQYDITIAIFNDGNYRDPYKVFTATVAPEYGNPWYYFDSSERLCCDITPAGVLCLAWRNSIPDEYEGKYIRYISVVEHDAGVNADNTVHLNRCDGIFAQAVADMITNSIPSSTSETYADDFESTWYLSHEGTGTEEGVTASLNCQQEGKTLFGQLALISPYGDDPIGNGSSTTATIDVSGLEIPKIKNSGYVGQYVNMATGEQYDVQLINGTNYVENMIIAHSFPATITPQSNGHFATIIFTVPLL